MNGVSDLHPAWTAFGAHPMRKPRGSLGAYRLRAPRTSPSDWCIEAVHGAYLGEHPYNLGGDAWRISIQRHDVDRDVFIETGFEIALSETQAIRKVRRCAEQIGDNW